MSLGRKSNVLRPTSHSALETDRRLSSQGDVDRWPDVHQKARACFLSLPEETSARGSYATG